MSWRNMARDRYNAFPERKQTKRESEEILMSTAEQVLREEVNLGEDECCIIFDFNCYYPYSDPENLSFRFSLGMEEITDYKLNHRYPNKNYYTLSRKYGRRVSKIGYPYVMKLDEQSPFILTFHIGLDDKHLTLHFPINVKMSKEKRACMLTFRFDCESGTYFFLSYEKNEDGNNPCPSSWKEHIWRCQDISNEPSDFAIVKTLTHAHMFRGENPSIVFEDTIDVPPSRIDDLLI